jgi:ABC-type amino acid transport substrate-binding protein
MKTSILCAVVIACVLGLFACSNQPSCSTDGGSALASSKNPLCTIDSDPALPTVEPPIPPPNAATLAQLTSTGRLRVGIVGQVPGGLLSTLDANGNPSGTSVDFACRLAAKLGVPLDFVGTHAGTLGSTYDGQPAMVAATNSGAFDVGIGIEAIINTVSPPALIANDTVGTEITFLVPIASSYASVKDVPDDHSISIGVTAGTAIEAQMHQRYHNVVFVTATTGNATNNLVKAGTVTVVANGRAGALNFIAQSWPGQGKVLPDTIFVESLAPFTSSAHPLAQCYLDDFVESARSSGLLQLIIDRTGAPATRVGRVVPDAGQACTSAVEQCQ